MNENSFVRNKTNLNTVAIDSRTAKVEALRVQATSMLARRMMGAGLWLSSSSLGSFLETQSSRGRKLERDLVIPALAPSDYANLMHSPYRRMRLRLVLAFGYEIGSIMHSCLYSGRNDRDSVAVMCSILNLMIVLFDCICDQSEGGVDQLMLLVNEPFLRSLLHDEGAQQKCNSRMVGIKHPESRALMAIMAAFFSRVNGIINVSQAPRAYERLIDLLIDAYRAEVVTAARLESRGLGEDVIAATDQKSLLPFQIMVAIAQMHENHTHFVNSIKAASLAEHLGAIFQCVDDLADLSNDYKNGDVNSILLRAGFVASTSGVSDENQDKLEMKLRRALQVAIETIVRSLVTAIQFAMPWTPSTDDTNPGILLPGYTQSWLQDSFLNTHHATF